MDEGKHRKEMAQRKGRQKWEKKEIEDEMEIEEMRKIELLKNYKGLVRRAAYS